MLLLVVSALTFLTVIGCQASHRNRRGNPFEGCPPFEGRNPEECPGFFNMPQHPGYQHMPAQPPEYALPPGYYEEGQSPYTNSPYWKSPLLFDRPNNFNSPPDTCPSVLSNLQNRLHHLKRPKPEIPKIRASLKDQTRKLLDDLLPKYSDPLHSPVYRGHHIDDSIEREPPNYSSQIENPPTDQDQDFEPTTQFASHMRPKMPATYPTQVVPNFANPKLPFRGLQRQQIQQYPSQPQGHPQHFPASATQFIADEEQQYLQRPMSLTTTPKPPFGNSFFDDFMPKYVETVPPPTCPASQMYKLQLDRPKIQDGSHHGQEEECPQGTCPAPHRYSAGSGRIPQNHHYGGSMGHPASSPSYGKR